LGLATSNGATLDTRLKTAFNGLGRHTLHQPAFFFCWSLHFCLSGSGSGLVTLRFGSDNIAHLARFAVRRLWRCSMLFTPGPSHTTRAIHSVWAFSAAARSRPIQVPLEAATGSTTGMYCGLVSASSLRHFRAVDFGWI
jgi:hypothetical protein